MTKTTKIFFYFLIALLLSCGGETYVASNDGGISGTGDGSVPGPGNGGNISSLVGSAYKGPFIQDSEVNVFNIGDDTGSIISNTVIEANLGDFTLEVEPGLLSVAASGRFYDETEASFSADSVTLRALINKAPDQEESIFVNVLTHLSHDYAIELIYQGHSYEKATELAEKRVKELLAAVTGDIPTSEPFNNMNISNSPGTVPGDNAYALYISSLLTEAVHERSIEEPQYTMTALLNALRENVIYNAPIDEATLTFLQEANGNLDASSIQQNLEAVLFGATIAPVGDVIEAVTPGLIPPSNLSTYTDPLYAIQSFCFDMGALCSDPAHKAEIIVAQDYTYEFQIDDNVDFSSPLASETGWMRNYFDIEAASLGSGTWYFRVRKKHDTGQYSTWAEVEFVVP